MCKKNRPVRRQSSGVRKWSIVSAPEARWILAGGGTTGNADNRYFQPRRGDRQILSIAPPGLVELCRPRSRWFHHRLISGAPPGQNSKAPGALLILFIIAAFAFNPAIAQTRPNIIFIHADDLGYGDLSCYGQQKFKTPNIDRLAAEGMRFTQYYAGSTVCAPSRSALMTGQHTGHTRIRGNARHPLLPEDVTVAEVLRSARYKTALIGKWGLGEAGTTGVPNRQGFDYFFGYLNQRHAHNYYPTFLWRDEERIKLRNVVPDEDKEGAGNSTDRVDYTHDLMAEESLKFIEQNRKEPFFLYLAFTIPHANNEAKNKGMEVPDLGEFANKDWPEQEKAKAAMIARMDRDIGRLMALLKKLGIDGKTLIFFTSDNGPHREGGSDPDFFDSNGPLRGIKRDLYEGGIRAPMIARWPKRIKAGAKSDQVWAHWDFLPTAAEIAGVKPPAGIDGVSMLNALLGRRQRNHEFLYWEFHERGFSQAARMGDWKAVRKSPDSPLELYDLRNDLGEQKDIAVKHPEVVEKIEDYLKTARTESELWPIKKGN
jgi:arylsulfatase A-like enzyme